MPRMGFRRDFSAQVPSATPDAQFNETRLNISGHQLGFFDRELTAGGEVENLP